MITKKELDKIALEYHSNDILKDKFIEDECQFYTYDWVFDYILEGDNILELGYGEGNFTEEIVRRNFIPTIIDGSEILLKSAKEKFNHRVKIVHELFEDFVSVEKFDVIVATHVLEHVDDPILLLNRLKNNLNQGGRIIIIVPNSNSIHRKLSVLMNLQPELNSLSGRDLLVGHQRVYNFELLEEHIKASGLDVIGKKGFFLKILPNSMMTEFSVELIKALNTISPEIDINLLANIGIVAKFNSNN
jgi:2-polyprenyl-3-methyl-5-hydroxy-6-metoxy-1,4-benzoquinol methylase